MTVLIAIAFKSLLIAGVTLGLLALMRRRSAAERSWVAHIGLLALVLLALAPLVLPSWEVEAPALLGSSPAERSAGTQPITQDELRAANEIAPAASHVVAQAAASDPALSGTAAVLALYAVPAAILLFITVLALARLIALRARAEVLVDGHWLSALARAQRRMGFKHGTALLTSDELASPISWGLMRPVILLNGRAVEAASEAEAIIAHELAHVARMDWVKLLLARIATALFWFNPLVWVLAREAHQLREEAADDAVLAADIADTDYAQLLVGVARHECPGLLLGAHGVAPSKSSLARRVARVLDGSSVRGPVPRAFALGVFAGAVLVAAPLAALTLTPGAPQDPAPPATAQAAAGNEPVKPYYPERTEVPADLPSLIADGVSAAVTAVAKPDSEAEREARAEAIAESVVSTAKVREIALAHAVQATARAQAIALASTHGGRIVHATELRAMGVTPEYVAAMVAAAPQLRHLETGEFAGMRAVGVTPDYARQWTQSGFRLDEDQLTEARAVGLQPSFVRSMRSLGVRGGLDEYVQLWAVGVRPDFVRRLRSAGRPTSDADELVRAFVIGNGRAGPPPRIWSPPGVPRGPAPGAEPNPGPDPGPDG